MQYVSVHVFDSVSPGSYILRTSGSRGALPFPQMGNNPKEKACILIGHAPLSSASMGKMFTTRALLQIHIAVVLPCHPKNSNYIQTK